jgi:hypothetical protein
MVLFVFVATHGHSSSPPLSGNASSSKDPSPRYSAACLLTCNPTRGSRWLPKQASSVLPKGTQRPAYSQYSAACLLTCNPTRGSRWLPKQASSVLPKGTQRPAYSHVTQQGAHGGCQNKPHQCYQRDQRCSQVVRDLEVSFHLCVCSY